MVTEETNERQKQKPKRKVPVGCSLFALLLVIVFYPIVRCTLNECDAHTKTARTYELLKHVDNALEEYRLQHGKYPQTLLPALTTPVSYLRDLPLDPYGSGETLLQYYAPEAGGWILFSGGPDGVYDIDPKTDYDPLMKETSLKLLQKTYSPDDFYNAMYNNDSPERRQKGDIWRRCDPDRAAQGK